MLSLWSVSSYQAQVAKWGLGRRCVNGSCEPSGVAWALSTTSSLSLSPYCLTQWPVHSSHSICLPKPSLPLSDPRPDCCLPHTGAHSESEVPSSARHARCALAQAPCMHLVPDVCAQNPPAPSTWPSQLHSWAQLQSLLHTHSLVGSCTPVLTLG